MFVPPSNNDNIGEMPQPTDLKSCFVVHKWVMKDNERVKKYFACHPFIKCTDFYHEIILYNYNNEYAQCFPIYGLEYTPNPVKLAPKGAYTQKTYAINFDEPAIALTGQSAQTVISNLGNLSGIEASLGLGPSVVLEYGEMANGGQYFILGIDPRIVASPLLMAEHAKLLRVMSYKIFSPDINTYERLNEHCQLTCNSKFYKDHFVSGLVNLEFYCRNINKINPKSIDVAIWGGSAIIRNEIHNFGFVGVNSLILAAMVKDLKDRIVSTYLRIMIDYLAALILSEDNYVAVSFNDPLTDVNCKHPYVKHSAGNKLFIMKFSEYENDDPFKNWSHDLFYLS